MKASYNWLKEFVDFTMPPRELGHAMTMAGFEVEAIEEEEGDTVFEIGVTPNRPDCLSIRGLAREISAILDIPMKEVVVDMPQEEGDGPSVSIEDPELCPRYTARVVKGVKHGPSPEWLSSRLELCGIRPTSNIVDITNYVLLELGQPMHAFDLDRLSGKKIIVRKAGSTNTFSTLDDVERKISNDTLMIWDDEKPVAVAGVMGGQNTEVAESTVNILLESAYFNPSSVRRTSKSLGLSSESSYRFERGVDKKAVILALDRAAQLVADIAGGTVSKATDEYPGPYEERKITVSKNRITSMIGVDIEGQVIEKTLRTIGFTIEKEDDDADEMTVTPPSYRDDVEMEVDITEEVARLYGYDNIPSTMPVMQMSPAPEHRMQELVKGLKTTLVKSGFSEAINYSFLNPDILNVLNISDEDRRRAAVPVKNPLRKEDSVMRTTLVPAILGNTSLNLKRGEKMLRFFEISNVFFKTDRKLPDEVIQLSIAFHKDVAASLWQTRHESFYDIKGALQNIFSELKIDNVTFVSSGDSAEPYLHPGKSCSIMIGRDKVGAMGALHPEVASALEISGDMTIAEIFDLTSILGATSKDRSFSPLPRYPYIERDSALIVDAHITASEIETAIMASTSDLIEKITLFDIYKGKPIPKDKKSLAFSVRYRSPERTLTDKEVDDVHTGIVEGLLNSFKAELRS